MISRRLWWLVFVISTVCIAVLVWLYLNLQASMHVSAQQALIRLSNQLPTKIAVGNYLDAQAQGVVDTRILLHHDLRVPLNGRYPANLAFDVVVPVEVDVDYQTFIHVDQNMPLSATTDLIYQKKYLPQFPLYMEIPIRLDVPFHLKRRYTLPIRIQFQGPVDLLFDEQIDVQLRHALQPKVQLNHPITLEKIAHFNAVLENVERETKANLEMQLQLPLKQIRP